MKAKMLLAFLVIYCGGVLGSEMTGKLVDSTSLRWEGSTVEGGIAPAYWDIAMRQPPADSIFFGGGEIVGDQRVLLTDTNKNQITIDVSMLGMQYQLAKNCSVLSAKSTRDAVVNDQRITVTGDSISEMEVKCNVTQTAFTHYRPIIDINENTIKNIFLDDKTLESGRYTARVNAKANYEYSRGGVRIRHHFFFPITINIDYDKKQTLKIELLNHDADRMKPTYFLDSVSGETTYRLKPTLNDAPFFSNLSMKLHSSRRNNGYFLKNNAAIENTNGIAFDVFCENCKGEQNIIINGQPTNQEPLFMAGQASEIRLKVKFDEIPLESLDDGTYAGSFSLVFEITDDF